MTSETIVDTALGKIRGVNTDGVMRFRSIPYGEPVTGEWRFRSPRPVSAWEVVHDADRVPTSSVQYPASIFDTALGEYFAGGPVDSSDFRQLIGENCLELSVLASTATGEPKPVLMYIHGGGFFAGSHALATASDQFVRENDVVLVGVNHRLGLLGFLSLTTMDDAFASSANSGLQDIVVALEWVRDHIAAFGGDPANVTIFGESGGGVKVASLLGMPAAAGLFHRAIIESSPRISFPTAEAAATTTQDVLAKLGIPPGAGAIEALQQLPAEELFTVSLTMPDAFGPHTDGDIVPASPFAPEWVPTTVVPLIVGSCADEFTWFATPALTDENSAALAREILGNHADAILGEYQAEYASDRAAILRAVSDSVFGSFVHRARAVWTPMAPLYTYVFSWNTPVSDGTLGAFHTAELPLVLRHVRYPQSETLSLQLAGLWSTFARTGKPTFDGVTWPPATQTDTSTLIFDEKTVTWGTDPTRPLFWTNRPVIDFSAASAIMAGPPV